jgi:acyl carrier protein
MLPAGGITMNEVEIYSALNEVFQDIFDDDSIKVNAVTTANDIEDWDSLEHIRLIAAVESRFKMRFTMGQVSSMKNVGEMVGIISSFVK